MTVVLDRKSSLNAWCGRLDGLWSSINHIGISRVSIERISSQDEPLCNTFFCEALRDLASVKKGTEITELSISSSAEFAPHFSCNDCANRHELSPLLRLLEMVNCSPALVNVMLPLVERLLARQAILRNGALEKVIIKDGLLQQIFIWSFLFRKVLLLGIDCIEQTYIKQTP